MTILLIHHKHHTLRHRCRFPSVLGIQTHEDLFKCTMKTCTHQFQPHDASYHQARLVRVKGRTLWYKSYRGNHGQNIMSKFKCVWGLILFWCPCCIESTSVNGTIDSKTNKGSKNVGRWERRVWLVWQAWMQSNQAGRAHKQDMNGKYWKIMMIIDDLSLLCYKGSFVPQIQVSCQRTSQRSHAVFVASICWSLDRVCLQSRTRHLVCPMGSVQENHLQKVGFPWISNTMFVSPCAGIASTFACIKGARTNTKRMESFLGMQNGSSVANCLPSLINLQQNRHPSIGHSWF